MHNSTGFERRRGVFVAPRHLLFFSQECNSGQMKFLERKRFIKIASVLRAIATTREVPFRLDASATHRGLQHDNRVTPHFNPLPQGARRAERERMCSAQAQKADFSQRRNGTGDGITMFACSGLATRGVTNRPSLRFFSHCSWLQNDISLHRRRYVDTHGQARGTL